MLEQEVNGETYVLVPKEKWGKVMDVLNRIHDLGDKYGNLQS